MFSDKKTVAQEQKKEEKEASDVDCTWAVLEGKRMGFETEEVFRMTYGNFLDYLITQNEEIRKKPEKKKEEERGSLLDL